MECEDALHYIKGQAGKCHYQTSEKPIESTCMYILELSGRRQSNTRWALETAGMKNNSASTPDLCLITVSVTLSYYVPNKYYMIELCRFLPFLCLNIREGKVKNNIQTQNVYYNLHPLITQFYVIGLRDGWISS